MNKKFHFDCLECGATWQSDIEHDWACPRCDRGFDDTGETQSEYLGRLRDGMLDCLTGVTNESAKNEGIAMPRELVEALERLTGIPRYASEDA